MNKATNYISELNELDEHVKIEAKQCTNKIDRSVLETIWGQRRNSVAELSEDDRQTVHEEWQI